MEVTRTLPYFKSVYKGGSDEPHCLYPVQEALCVFILCLSLAPLAEAQQRLIFGHILEESTAHHRQLLWAVE